MVDLQSHLQMIADSDFLAKEVGESTVNQFNYVAQLHEENVREFMSS
jgi:hypothetical protein